RKKLRPRSVAQLSTRKTQFLPNAERRGSSHREVRMRTSYPVWVILARTLRRSRSKVAGRERFFGGAPLFCVGRAHFLCNTRSFPVAHGFALCDLLRGRSSALQPTSAPHRLRNESVFEPRLTPGIGCSSFGRADRHLPRPGAEMNWFSPMLFEVPEINR